MPYNGNGFPPLMKIGMYRKPNRREVDEEIIGRTRVVRASYASDDPFDALPRIAREAALEIQRNIGAPANAIRAALMTVMVAIAQARIHLLKPDGEATHVPIYIINADETGLGKTPATNRCYAVLKAHDERCDAQSDLALADYASDLESWEIDRKIFKNRYEIAMKKGTDASLIADAKATLREHGRIKPKEPKPRNILSGDVSMPAIMKLVDGINECLVLVSDESEKFFNGLLKHDQAELKQFWDLGTVHRKRYNHVHTAINANLTISLTTQPDILRDAIENLGVNAVKSGFLPRFLISCVMSKFSIPAKPVIDASWVKLNIFQDQVAAFIKQRAELVDNGKFEWITYKFDDEAVQLYEEILSENRTLMSPGGDWEGIKDFVLKEPENIVRVAATFHFFGQQPEAEISSESLRNATTMVDSFMDSTKSIFVDDKVEREVEKLVNLLHRTFWLRKAHFKYLPKELHDFAHIPKNLVLQLGHYLTADLEPLLKILQKNGTVRIPWSTDPTCYISLNPDVFGNR